MIIGGLQKLTLLDFPRYVACTIFTIDCNMRCPFCQNAGLVLPERINKTSIIETAEVFDFLKKRKRLLQGVCITGGEPTLQSDLPQFIHQIRNLGYKVKLDTNGTNPDMLTNLLHDHMLDYIAMDIKADPSSYSILSGCPSNINIIRKSIDIIKNAGIDYEFRTTVTAEGHSMNTFINIGKMINHAKNYSLQYYEASENVLNPIFHTPSESDMQTYADILRQYADNIAIKGR